MRTQRELDKLRALYMTKPHGFSRLGLGITCRLCGNLRKHALHTQPDEAESAEEQPSMDGNEAVQVPPIDGEP